VIKGQYADIDIARHVLRPRTILYSVILVCVATAMVVSLSLRIPLRFDVMRDRNALARETADGLVENSYRLNIINMDDRAQQYILSAKGVENLVIRTDVAPLEVPALSSRLVSVRLQADPSNIKGRTAKIEFDLVSSTNPKLHRSQKSTFFSR
jgi:polyferredoxin